VRARRLLAWTAAAAVSLLPGAPGAAASVDPLEFHPTGMRVEGGEESWHASNVFRLSWSNPTDPARPSTSPVAAVYYQVRDGGGAIAIPERRLLGDVTWIDPLEVPDAPDAYRVEVWLEDSSGFKGGKVSAALRFDDGRPGTAAPSPPPSWIDLDQIPYPVRIGHPSPQPLSGIAGYAVSVDRSPTGQPCASTERCLPSELDLRGGESDDTISLPELPEGTSYVHTVAVSGSGMRSAAVGTVALHVDRTMPVTVLEGAPSGWSDRPVALTATASDALSGMAAAGPSGPMTAIRVDGGAPQTAPGGSVGAVVIGEGAHSVEYYARDAAGNVNDGSDSNPLVIAPPSTAVVRIDRADPAVAFADSQDPDDPELIVARVADQLSGPDPSRGQIAVRRHGSTDAWEPLPTEAAGGELRARWNSDDYPPGSYEFRATGYDRAGNAAASTLRANGTAMVLANPLKDAATVAAGFGGRRLVWQRCARHGGRRRCRRETIAAFDGRPAMRTVPYGRGTLFSGSLTGRGGAPLAGRTVEVVERFDPGAEPAQRTAAAQTGADGVFTVWLPPGPSRTVTASFAGTRTLSRAEGRPVRLAVRGGVRLRASSRVAKVGGPPLLFRGEVGATGAPLPPEGKSVQLQFRLPGMPWEEFRTVRTDSRGRFRYAYRFADDDSRGVRFQFRAVAATQAGWPFEPGASAPIFVWGA
jgi:hypothetical protein